MKLLLEVEEQPYMLWPQRDKIPILKQFLSYSNTFANLGLAHQRAG
jgi:hypothetical protein